MTDKQKTLKNLKKVYDELPLLAEKFPNIKNEFDMRIFGVFYGEYRDRCKIDKCGTAGCLLGNAALLFRVKKIYFNKEEEFDYNIFAKDIFPSLYDDDLENKWWRFLFSPEWGYYQPNFDQAMKRLKYFLDKDGEIGEWEYQKEDFILINH